MGAGVGEFIMRGQGGIGASRVSGSHADGTGVGNDEGGVEVGPLGSFVGGTDVVLDVGA